MAYICCSQQITKHSWPASFDLSNHDSPRHRNCHPTFALAKQRGTQVPERHVYCPCCIQLYGLRAFLGVNSSKYQRMSMATDWYSADEPRPPDKPRQQLGCLPELASGSLVATNNVAPNCNPSTEAKIICVQSLEYSPKQPDDNRAD